MSLAGPLPSPGKGLRFLSFDGGGIQAVSQALMVKEMMNRVEVDCELPGPARVCDYFDMICGSGFGGVLAIMCGILKMTGDQLVCEFVNLCKAVFSEGLDATQRSAVLEQEMKRMIGKYSTEGEERGMFCEHDTCKTFVCATTSHNTDHPRLFCNYRSRDNLSLDCMLWEAACATTAMPDLFNPIIIGNTNIKETFVGGDLRWNNPTDELTKQGAHVLKGRRICSIINIGSGHPGHMSLSKGLASLFRRIALDCERVADDMECRFGNTPEVFWRLNVEQGLRDLAVDLSHLDALVSHTHSYLQSARTRRNIKALSQDLIRCPERIPIESICGVAPAVMEVLRRKLCPPPTQHFTGRRSELKKLDGYFSPNTESTSRRVAVLYGIGGGGKSQMGLEFVRRSQNRFTDVFFADASDKFTLENDLKTIAIGLSDKPTIEDALHFLRTTQGEWLLFLDNADDPSLDLRPYIMWPHGNVLITTRNREVRTHAPDCDIWVDKLELDDAVELLLRDVAIEKTLETYKIASEIVQKLGCLALAVNQARGFLAQDICTLDEYLPIYTQNRKKLLEDRLIQTTDDYKHTVYTTWTISFNKLSSPAVHLLELLCFMHHEAIPSRIFEDAWKNYKEIDEDAIPTGLVTFLSSFQTTDSTWDILRFRMLVKEILSFSLIEFNTGNHTFSLHPLVQQWAQSQCRHSQEVICSTQTLLSLATPRGDSKEDFVMTLSLLPHLRASAQTGLDVHFTLLRFFGRMYDRGGMFQECAAVHKQEKSLMQNEFGFEHPYTLISMNNLAGAYSNLGRHMDALKLQEQVLDLRLQFFGWKHPDTLINMNNVARTYSDLGQDIDALKLQEQVLKLMTQILGEEHRYTPICINNLAITYSRL
ncbi:acyl transferase/acyl hydrolase/lysophospholipase, partial [Flagelloscypha sp. PMI_526]